jgi:cation diffusion facilitator CzcD-associated flavoprotein CzcO
VIGTGASSIQFVPQIQPQVEQLKLFQRTPARISTARRSRGG